MNLTFAQIAPFVAEWRRLKLTDEDLQALESLVSRNPAAGVLMPGTGGLRKIRFAPPSWRRGKSGSTRVCYVLFAEIAHCYLISIFAKNDKANLSAADKKRLRQWIDEVRRQLREE